MACLSSVSRLLTASRHVLKFLSLFTLLPTQLLCPCFIRHVSLNFNPSLSSSRFVIGRWVYAFCEFFDLVIFEQLLKEFVDGCLLGRALLGQLTQFLLLSIAFLLELFEFIIGLARLFLNPGEEVNEALSIVLKKLFRATKTHLPHVLMLHQFSYFLVLCFNHVLDQEHLSFLFNQLPPTFSVFWSLNRNIHTTCFRNLYFALNFRING